MGFVNHNAPLREKLLWAFCRVLANENRLRLLFEIVRSAPLSVAQLSAYTGILETNTSMQLKELHTYGLITPYRQKQSVYYAIRERPPETYPKILLPPLIDAEQSALPISEIIHLATAFTHQRRVEIARMLSGHPQTTAELLDSSNIKRSALNRHLSKLINRGFVVRNESAYCLHCPEKELGKALLKAALH